MCPWFDSWRNHKNHLTRWFFCFISMLGEIPQKEEKIVIYSLFKMALNKLLLFHFYILKINTLALKLN
ncbi:hypothetical protein CMU31_16685 [Elizabethkingia anophelis]|nr:hypothetical protein [Elizabethkingia anophelis]MDV4069522.1 hypothetical protein [Elizabethkingia anophelis]